MFSREGSKEMEAVKLAVIDLARLITAGGAKVRFLAMPAYRDGDALFGNLGYDSMQKALNRGYRDYRGFIKSAGMDAEIIYVGDAWDYVHDHLAGPNPTQGETLFTKLYNEGGTKKGWLHGTHPSEAGVYLTACAVYSELLDASPVGISWSMPQVDAHLRDQLQRAAFAAYQERKSAVYLPYPPPSPPPPTPLVRSPPPYVALSPPPYVVASSPLRSLASPPPSPPPPPPPPSSEAVEPKKTKSEAKMVAKEKEHHAPPPSRQPPPPIMTDPLATSLTRPEVSSSNTLTSITKESAKPQDFADVLPKTSIEPQTDFLAPSIVGVIALLAFLYGLVSRSSSKRRVEQLPQDEELEAELDDTSSQLFLMSDPRTGR